MTALLKTVKLTKRFGGIVANEDIDIEVQAGTFHSIIGPNGAGKTTLFNLLSGVMAPTSGRIFYRGIDISGWAPHRIAAQGLGRSFQITNIFPHLTVRENVRLAMQRQSMQPWNLLRPADAQAGRVERVLERARLEQRASQMAVSLPHGDKRKLELAIILAQEPDCLLLDEPTAGISREEVPAVLEVIQDIRKTAGKTILMVEHKMDIVMGISDRITVLDFGRVLAEGTPREIADNIEVQTAYLGSGIGGADAAPGVPGLRGGSHE